MNITRSGTQPSAKGKAVEWLEHVTDEQYAATPHQPGERAR